MSPIQNNPFDEDNFYAMDGSDCRCGCCPRCEQKSNALGGLLPSRAERQKNRARRQALRGKRQDARQTRRQTRADSKFTQADSSRIAAESLGRESQSDIELAKALSSPPSGSTESGQGMSKGTKTGIIVASVLVLGVIGFFTYKAITKKK